MEILRNPLKPTVNKLIESDKLHMLCGILTAEDLYCWKSCDGTYSDAFIQLSQQEKISPICCIMFDKEKIQVADTWKVEDMSYEDKEKTLHHISLEYLFGKGYKVIGLNDENR